MFVYPKKSQEIAGFSGSTGIAFEGRPSPQSRLRALARC